MRTLIYVLFFLSGASALIYETLWQRLMILVFGASAPATTAVFTAFFAGIAFGSLAGGKLLRRFSNALWFYSAVELWIGAWAASVPFVLRRMDVLYVGLLQLTGLGDSGQLLSFTLRFVMAVLVVLPASLGMGATIPVMSRIIQEMRQRNVGMSVGFAYGINTFGAVLGTVVTGFYLIKSFGIHNSLIAAFSLNLCVFLGSFCLGRSYPRSSLSAPMSHLSKWPVKQRAMLLIYFCVGFLALAYEIIWFRILGILGTNSVYTFVIGLSVYLSGFSTGSLLVYPFLNRKLKGLHIFYAAILGVGVSALVGIPFLQQFSGTALRHGWRLAEGNALSLSATIQWEVIFAILLMFVPTIFMGLSFPALCQYFSERKENIGELSGATYFVGNLGSIVGVIFSGLIIIPFLGLHWGLSTYCILNLVLATVVLLLHSQEFTKKVFLLALSAISFILALYNGIESRPFTHAGGLVFNTEKRLWQRVRSSVHTSSEKNLIYYKAGPSGTVTVFSERSSSIEPFQTRLYVDDQPVASTHTYSKVDYQMLAHLPLFLHPNPKNALSVGFGSGGTSWSMTTHDIQVFTVEIEPRVIETAPLFADLNHNVLEHKNFHLIMNDARDHLHTTHRKYDVISTDVTNLQYKQNSSLYTKEYFQLMKRKLTPEGIACAWIPIGIPEDELKVLLRTFADVFPHASFWYFDHVRTNFAILLATPEPMKFHLQRFREAFSNRRVRKDLEGIGIYSPFQLVSFLYLEEKGYREYVGSGDLHTDVRPVLEFSSPVSFYYCPPLGALLSRIEAFRPKSYSSELVTGNEDDLAQCREVERLSRQLGKANRKLLTFPHHKPSILMRKRMEEQLRQFD